MLVLFEPSSPSILHLCRQTSALFFSPKSCGFTTDLWRANIQWQWDSCPPTSLVSHSCFGRAWGRQQVLFLSGPGERHHWRGEEAQSSKVRKAPPLQPPPLAQQMTFVKTAEIIYIDCLLQMVLWVLLWGMHGETWIQPEDFLPYTCGGGMWIPMSGKRLWESGGCQRASSLLGTQNGHPWGEHMELKAENGGDRQPLSIKEKGEGQGQVRRASWARREERMRRDHKNPGEREWEGNKEKRNIPWKKARAVKMPGPELGVGQEEEWEPRGSRKIFLGDLLSLWI